MTDPKDTPTTHPLVTQAEMHEYLRDLIRLREAKAEDASTFLDHTHDEEGGRFAKQTKIVGHEPPLYPKQPDTNWTNQGAIVPPEPPFGETLDPPIVGEPWEVERHLRSATPLASSPEHLAEGDAPSSEVSSKLATATAPPRDDPASPTQKSNDTPVVTSKGVEKVEPIAPSKASPQADINSSVARPTNKPRSNKWRGL